MKTGWKEGSKEKKEGKREGRNHNVKGNANFCQVSLDPKLFHVNGNETQYIISYCIYKRHILYLYI